MAVNRARVRKKRFMAVAIICERIQEQGWLSFRHRPTIGEQWQGVDGEARDLARQTGRQCFAVGNWPHNAGRSRPSACLREANATIRYRAGGVFLMRTRSCVLEPLDKASFLPSCDQANCHMTPESKCVNKFGGPPSNGARQMLSAPFWSFT